MEPPKAASYFDVRYTGVQKAMHVCYICSEYPPAPHGGIGSFTQTLARALVKRGHRVTAIGMYNKAYAGVGEDEGVNVIRLSWDGHPLLRFLPNRQRLDQTLRELHAANPIDIIEGGELDIAMLNRSAPGEKILRMHGGPRYLPKYVAQYASQPYIARSARRGVKLLKERWAYHVADHICAVGQYVAETTRELLNLGSRPIEVIPNPIDTELFSPGPADAEETGLVVFSGTVKRIKGIGELVAAMPRIVEEAPEAHLEVYGGEDPVPSSSVPISESLRTSIPPEIAAKIQWKGRRPRAEVAQALKRAAVCAYPSHMEAMPIAWLEGLATGKAVVASQAGPGPEVIEDGVTGLLCDPHDPQSIAEKVLRLLKDEPLRRALGAAARQVAVERYSLDPLVDRNLEYYSRLLKRAPQAAQVPQV